MNIDKSDYYPQSNLDDDFEEEILVISDIPEAQPGPPAAPEPPRFNGGKEFHDDTPAESSVTIASNLLSWILVPMLMPVYGIILGFGLTILTYTAFGVKLAFTAITFGFNVMVPGIIVVLLKKFGYIKDIGLNNREERFVPFIICIVCLIGTALFMSYKGAPQWLVMFFMGGAAAGIVEVIINRWWKISVHSAGIAGIVAMILHLMIYDYTVPSALLWLMISISCAGLLGAARIWLGRHTLWQVMAGYAVGFCAVFFIMFA